MHEVIHYFLILLTIFIKIDFDYESCYYETYILKAMIKNY